MCESQTRTCGFHRFSVWSQLVRGSRGEHKGCRFTTEAVNFQETVWKHCDVAAAAPVTTSAWMPAENNRWFFLMHACRDHVVTGLLLWLLLLGAQIVFSLACQFLLLWFPEWRLLPMFQTIISALGLIWAETFQQEELSYTWQHRLLLIFVLALILFTIIDVSSNVKFVMS